MRNLALFLAFAVCAFESIDANVLFPLHGALFLPHSSAESLNYLATIESVAPILEIATEDGHRLYLQGWAPKNWLQIRQSPIQQCDDQHSAAWSALEAHQWTNGSGLDLAFGPSCDYSLATIARILSYYNTALFTNAGFSVYFDAKENLPLTRVGPLQNYILLMISQLATNFSWQKSQVLYEKSFWSSEMLEGSYCKLLMTDMYAWSVNKMWNLTVNPRIVPSYSDETAENRREQFRSYLMSNVGSEYGGWFLRLKMMGNAKIIK
ncbi:hypothetical protein M3Y94_00570700 [Aphelenchoides besseyi]|nr:hypothetical protein M3Y94_00570700 [Aphelenchoides besseyi]KAI6218100.1 hypothetical protein M3Y95_01184300 [Aphelenchoides besseyi]